MYRGRAGGILATLPLLFLILGEICPMQRERGRGNSGTRLGTAPPALCKCYVDLTGAESVHIKREGGRRPVFGPIWSGESEWWAGSSGRPPPAKKSPDWNGVELVLNLGGRSLPKECPPKFCCFQCSLMFPNRVEKALNLEMKYGQGEKF